MVANLRYQDGFIRILEYTGDKYRLGRSQQHRHPRRDDSHNPGCPKSSGMLTSDMSLYRRQRGTPVHYTGEVSKACDTMAESRPSPLIDTVRFVDHNGSQAVSELDVLPELLKAHGQCHLWGEIHHLGTSADTSHIPVVLELSSLMAMASIPLA